MQVPSIGLFLKPTLTYDRLLCISQAFFMPQEGVPNGLQVDANAEMCEFLML